MDSPPKLLPLGSMAHQLRVTTKWLRNEAESGRVPYLKADRRLLFDPETIERLLLERASAGSEPKPKANAPGPNVVTPSPATGGSC